MLVDFEANGLSKQVNIVQKEIGAKKKVFRFAAISSITFMTDVTGQRERR